MSEAIAIGIDPGKGGGIAVYRGGVHEAWKMPLTERDLWTVVSSLATETAWCMIENPASMIPGSRGVQGIKSIQYSYGLCVMAVTAAGIRWERVSPGKWQREFGLYGKGYTTDTIKKNAHKTKAQELFPRLKITHAIADALLIAEYCRRVRCDDRAF